MSLIETLDLAIESEQDQTHRAHLGASIIGRPCPRAMWYSFRWFKKPSFPARLLRIFRLGHLVEKLMIDDLKKSYRVYDKDENGKQFGFKKWNGHFAGSCDAVAVIDGVPHVVEAKSAKDAGYKNIVRKGVKEAHPEYYAQVQVYMHNLKVPKALVIVEDKDTSARHMEVIDAVAEVAESNERFAKDVIDSPFAPPRIGGPDWWLCRNGMCQLYDVCQQGAPKEVNCRTCRHSKPSTVDGEPPWRCELHMKSLTIEEQQTGCGDHREIV